MSDDIINFYKKASDVEEVIPEIVTEEVKSESIEISEDDPLQAVFQTLVENLQKTKASEFNKPKEESNEEPFAKFLGNVASIIKEDSKLQTDEQIKEATIGFINKIKDEDLKPVEEKKRRSSYVPAKLLKNYPKKRSSKIQVIEPKEVVKEEPVVEEVEEPTVRNAYVKELKTKDDKVRRNHTPSKPTDLKSLVEKKVREEIDKFSQHFAQISMTAGGGGSVAVQYAKGGTMNGDLNVTGKYLSGGRDLATLFSRGGGGTPTNSLSANGYTLTLNNDGSVTFPDNVIRAEYDQPITLVSESTNDVYYTGIALSPYAFYAYDNAGNNIYFNSTDNNVVIETVSAYPWTFGHNGVFTGPNNIFTVGGTISALGPILSGGKNIIDIFTSSQAYTFISATSSIQPKIGRNTASGCFSKIGGGQYNIASGCYSTIAGGLSGTASGNYSFIGGGCCNCNPNYVGVIVGGAYNIINSDYSFIGGGYCNCTSNEINAVVVGGNCNAASGPFTFIGGGACNVAGSYNTIVVGGLRNIITGDAANSNIVGGCYNTICSPNGENSIVGGFCNTISNYIGGNFIGGGFCNTSSSYYGLNFIGGGVFNQICGCATESVVVGGNRNTSSGAYSSVVGGVSNTASGRYSFVGNGYHNSAGENSGIVGGTCNSTGNGAFIGGGKCNTASDYNVVVGGSCNTVSGYDGGYSFIGGGLGNCIKHQFDGDGNFNRRNFIGGGMSNCITASGYCTNLTSNVLVGGFNNKITNVLSSNADYSSIIGGAFNGIYNSCNSSILGGCNNSLSATNSFILGSNIKANVSNYTFVNNLSSQSCVAMAKPIFSCTGTAGSIGTFSKRVSAYDASGTYIGYIPIYI